MNVVDKADALVEKAGVLEQLGELERVLASIVARDVVVLLRVASRVHHEVVERSYGGQAPVCLLIQMSFKL